MFVGGRNASLSNFRLPVDPVTMHVQANLLLNFCLDVAGYGLLGLVVAWLVYSRASWGAYLLGVCMIGICDMSFMFLQLTSGIISLNIASVSGPIVWLLAASTTPFGLPALSKGSDLKATQIASMRLERRSLLVELAVNNNRAC